MTVGDGSDYRQHGVRIVHADELDTNTPQTPGMHRAAAINALGNKAGTVVVMEAQTGKVLTIVNQDWAIRNAYRPCSTIKLVTGVAGLTEHVINDEGGVGNSTSGMSLETALARSNNQYFQHVGSYLGSSRMVSYARKLGLAASVIEDACRGIDTQGSLAAAWTAMEAAGVKRVQSSDFVLPG